LLVCPLAVHHRPEARTWARWVGRTCCHRRGQPPAPASWHTDCPSACHAPYVVQAARADGASRSVVWGWKSMAAREGARTNWPCGKGRMPPCMLNCMSRPPCCMYAMFCAAWDSEQLQQNADDASHLRVHGSCLGAVHSGLLLHRLHRLHLSWVGLAAWHATCWHHPHRLLWLLPPWGRRTVARLLRPRRAAASLLGRRLAWACCTGAA
jgi:hypothetical protein